MAYYTSMHLCVCVCVCACVRACVRVCVRVCVCTASVLGTLYTKYPAELAEVQCVLLRFGLELKVPNALHW